MRKINRKKIKKQRKIIIFATLSLLLIMVTGYAAFNTNLNISAKGNIIKQSASGTLKKLCNTTTGDGLYKDEYEAGRCVYKGGNPNNYIIFNDEMWRIISVENDNTLKIVRENGITKMSWDAYGTTNNRFSTNEEDYCYGTSHIYFYGCNIWGDKYSTLDNNGNNVTEMPYANDISDTYFLPETSSAASIYLNTTYYESLSSVSKEQITKHQFNVGFVAYPSQNTFSINKQEEQKYQWLGLIGLPSAYDYAYATTNNACIGVFSYHPDSQSTCPNNIKNHNWFTNTDYRFWTITAFSGQDYRRGAWKVELDGSMNYPYVHNSDFNLRPVLFLKADIKITGQGTEKQPYQITK